MPKALHQQVLQVPAALPTAHFVRGFPEKSTEARRGMLQALGGCQEFGKLAAVITQADAYSPTGPSNVLLNLHKNADGSVLGIARRNGKIIGQARWIKTTEIGARVITSAALLAGHAMLIDISMKLDRIETKVDYIAKLLNTIVWKNLEGDISAVTTALSLTKAENKTAVLTATTPKLESDLKVCIKALTDDIAGMPSTPDFAIVKLVNDPSKAIRQTLVKSEASFAYILLGIKALAQLYVGIGEQKAAWCAMERLFEELEKVGIDRAERKARMLEYSKHDPFPERFWTDARSLISETLMMVRQNIELDDNEDDCRPIEVEFTSAELAKLTFQPLTPNVINDLAHDSATAKVMA